MLYRTMSCKLCLYISVWPLLRWYHTVSRRICHSKGLRAMFLIRSSGVALHRIQLDSFSRRRPTPPLTRKYRVRPGYLSVVVFFV